MLVLQQFACSLVGGSGGGSGWAEKGGGGFMLSQSATGQGIPPADSDEH